jgi:ornithine decarboxylase
MLAPRVAGCLRPYAHGAGLLRRRGLAAAALPGRTRPASTAAGTAVAVTALREHIDKSGAEQAFFHVNLSEVVRQHTRWCEQMPRVKPHYAVKCNNDPRVLATLADLGCNFDCASAAEMEALLQIGVAPERIIYANPCKSHGQLRYAQAHGVTFTVFDSEDELHKIKDIMPEARLLVRIRPDDSRSVCKFGMKYGADVESELRPLLGTAAELGLNVEGVSFHVGSGCYAAEAFGDAVVLAREAFDIAADLDCNFSVLDIGGGFPGAQIEDGGHESVQDCAAALPDGEMVRQGGAPSFEAIAKVTRAALDEHFPPSCGVELLSEPGRYFVNTSHTLATRVIGHKIDTYSESAAGTKQYYIDDGIYGSFNCLMYDHAEVTPYVLRQQEQQSYAAAQTNGEAASETCSIWGPTCDGLDCIKRDAVLPPLQTGDWLFWESMGAYTAAAASSFNGFAPPQAVYYYDGVPMEAVESVEAAIAMNRAAPGEAAIQEASQTQ